MILLYPEVLLLLFGTLWLYLKKESRFFAHKEDRFLFWALVLMILALARPVWLEHKSIERSFGNEAIIALDLSYSMQGEDIAPNRFEAAKALLHTLWKEDQHNRYGLYGFTTKALILSPPTTDHILLAHALDAIEIKNILTHGTSLKHLFQTLGKRAKENQTLILLSDGGEERDFEGLLSLLKRGRMKLIVVDMATSKGVLLRDRYQKPLRKEDGSLVISRKNPLLKKLAKESGGEYIAYQNPLSTARTLLESLAKVAQKESFKVAQKSFLELFWVPLLLALVLLLAAFVKIPKKFLALLPFLPLTLDASLLDWYHIQEAKEAFLQKHYTQSLQHLRAISHVTLQSRLDEAIVLYHLKEFRQAQMLLRDWQSKEPSLLQKKLFLEGNIYYQKKQYSKARELYQRALLLGFKKEIFDNLKAILGKKDRIQPKPPVYAKKNSAKAGFAQKSKKSRQKSKEQKQKNKKALSKAHPLGYRAYELINEGYIDEKNPW